MRMRHLRHRISLLGALLTLCCVNGGAVLDGQSLAPTFEVATVKRYKPEDGQKIGVFALPNGRLEIRGLPLRALIYMAYSSNTIVAPGQVVGGPSWLDSDFFEIVAKGDGEFMGHNGYTPHVLAMLRSLLIERFQLRVRSGQRELLIYELVRGNKNEELGPKLSVSTIACPASTEAAPSSPDRWCGFRRSKKTSKDGIPMMDVHAQGVTMSEVGTHFARYPIVARPIFDRTNLNGRYDIDHLDYVQGAGSMVSNPHVDLGPSLFTSLVEQLGLRLRAARSMVDVVVVERAQHPTEN